MTIQDLTEVASPVDFTVIPIADIDELNPDAEGDAQGEQQGGEGGGPQGGEGGGMDPDGSSPPQFD